MEMCFCSGLTAGALQTLGWVSGTGVKEAFDIQIAELRCSMAGIKELVRQAWEEQRPRKAQH